MSVLALVKLSYFIAATLFLLGLQRMASPKTARSGIQWAGLGMVLAISPENLDQAKALLDGKCFEIGQIVKRDTAAVIIK